MKYSDAPEGSLLRDLPLYNPSISSFPLDPRVKRRLHRHGSRLPALSTAAGPGRGDAACSLTTLAGPPVKAEASGCAWTSWLHRDTLEAGAL